MKNDLTHNKFERRAKKAYALFASLVLAMACTIVPAFAAGGRRHRHRIYQGDPHPHHWRLMKKKPINAHPQPSKAVADGRGGAKE